jgi:hypothetical protein
MAIPTIFTQQGGEAVASYDWLDYNNKVGYGVYYGAFSEDSTGIKKILTPIKMDANPSSQGYGMTVNVGEHTFGDVDFDIEFKTNARIGGTAYLNMAFRDIAGNSSNSITWRVVATIYHVTSSGTETSLGTITSADNTRTGDDGYGTYREFLTIPITAKRFITGEKLRLNITLTGSEGGNGTIKSVTLYADPTNLNVAIGVNTDLTLQIPFKIEL